ncbi:RiPP maturation radical SAM C-methyltransferase [Actinomadura algeriensis]|uniref:Ribosomal peptide maturation radical SAM protein 1 n=1 Tax=Actinomadura algeriensis TaxID=1679523 RepID=A0ABR9JIN6_9ACTN|nr:RiPP maturation radical SAM C-methyltransferase [Actinomadura algeriensis]MBE1530424.1 ribosomal peptide maturation radical SAM protein 1 [Actinomadura algeriensis]
MRILLVSMPWAAIDMPPIGLGVLARLARTKLTGIDVRTVSGNLDYIDWLAERSPMSMGDYKFFAVDSHFESCGDWVFAPALHDTERHAGEFEQMARTRFPGERVDRMLELRALSDEFVRDFAERIVAMAPDVVGFTSTFQQNVASLAAARHVKRLAPEIVTVFGGANCDGPQGAAVHRNFPYVDHVVRGEGELNFPALVEALRGKGRFEDVPGLVWRRADGTSVANPMDRKPLPPGVLVTPDYDDFFERWSTSVARSWVEPVLVMEGSRGCWWGDKHHCTFCGLNGSYMEFRSKSPGRFYEEVMELVERHRTLDVYMVDNILDMSYLTSVLPRLTEADHDLRIHCEVKANLRHDQLRVLADAGVVVIQPGIENLNSHVLKLMDKGVTGCQNVRFIRDGESLGIKVVWNYLYGFPGETADDYTAVIEQFPALHHLRPPDAVSRIVIERFSPYFDRPELGFPDLRPARAHRLIYDLPEDECFDLSYSFEARPAGIDDRLADRLDAAAAEWQEAAADSRLTYHDLGDRIVLINTRPRFDWSTLVLEDPVECALFRLLDDPRSVPSVSRKLSAKFAGRASETTISEILADWRERGVVFTDNGHFIHVAAVAANRELLRTGTSVHRRAASTGPDASRLVAQR